MKLAMTIASISLSAVLAIGPAEDAARERMDEMNRRAATRPATTKSSTRAATRPAKGQAGEVKYEWRLKAGSPPELQQVIDEQEAIRSEETASLKAKLETAEKNLKWVRANRGTDYEIRTAKREVDVLKLRLSRIGSDRSLLFRSCPSPLVMPMGFIGRSEMSFSLLVRQVIDDRNAVVDLELAGREARSVWLTGVDASDWRDGQIPNGSFSLFISKKPKSYETAIGSQRTIPHLQPFSTGLFERVPVAGK